METSVTNASSKGSAKRHFIAMVLLGIMIMGAVMYANAWKARRHVAEVIVEGNRVIPAREILALADVSSGSLLFELDLFAIEQRVEKNHFVKSAEVHRDIPDRIRITVEERVPVAAMIVNDKLYYVDAEGYVLPPVRSQFLFDLPVLTGKLGCGECVPGRKTMSKNILEALHLLAVANEVNDELGSLISEISFTESSGMVITTSDAGVPVIVGRENIGSKLLMLDAFWFSEVSLRGAHQLEYVDLRFEDQVVVRWQQERNGGTHS